MLQICVKHVEKKRDIDIDPDTIITGDYMGRRKIGH